MRVIDRFAENEDAVLFARSNEVDKCEFIKANAPEDAWASTDDGAGLLVKAKALREQAREVLVSAARCRASSLPQPAMWALTYFRSPPFALIRGKRCGLRRRRRLQRRRSLLRRSLRPRSRKRRRTPAAAASRPPPSLLLTYY